MFAGLPDTIGELELKGLSDKKIKPPVTATNSLSPKLELMKNSRRILRFKGSCLKQDKAFPPKIVANLFIVYVYE